MASSQLSRRDFLRLGASVTAGALITGCASVAPQPAGSAGRAPSAEMVELSFDMYNFDPWLRALNDMFADYMETHPGVTVKVESAPWEEFWPRQEARLAAGTPPDLSIGDPGYFGRYAHKGYYLAMEPCIEGKGVDLGQWFESTINDARYDSATGIVGQGTLYGMPATFVGTVLYYNENLFDAAGLAYPDDTWDRDDLLQAALALTLDASGNRAGDPGFDPEDIAQWGISMIGSYPIAVTVWNNGGELISADQTECRLTEPQTVEMFEWLAALLHKHHVNPTPAQLEGLPNPFQVGKVAMTMDGTWNLDYFANNTEFNWDIAPVPLGTAGLDRVTYGGTNTLHIFKATAHPEAACDLILWMAGPGGMAHFMKTGTPALIEAARSDAYLSGPPEHREVAVELGNYSRTYYPGLKSDRWKEIYNAELEALWLNKAPAAAVLQTICDKITPILQTPIDEL
ncbi:substrate-binding domain-containing protein [Litorilinea aerophila]|nr:substrate-binding domain-containing protein [Litorilinea aerophila]MCC9074991.1 substrate-binding domain-containing protein [Litorilinea aerophila]